MTISRKDRAALLALDDRLNTLLPEEYQGAYDDVQPTPMGSAALKLDADGRVAWDEMWASFCDLAMAGGPPHKGMLLEPASAAAIEAEPARHAAVVDEICRGIRIVTDLDAAASPVPGWIRVTCFNPAMAGWLLRAIVMENVAVRAEDATLDLPAGPAYRLEKEIKNVITVMAKTCHYWTGHVPRAQQRAIGQLFAAMAVESPLVAPKPSRDGTIGDDERIAAVQIGDRISADTGLPVSERRYAGWLGIECPTVRAAVWMMRAMVVSNVLARREATVLFVPVDPEGDPQGRRVTSTVRRIHALAAASGVP